MTLDCSALRCLCAAILLYACGGGWSEARAAQADLPSAHSTVQLSIFGPDGRQPIGYGQYTSSQAGTSLLLNGENRYLDGQYDIESGRLEAGTEADQPILLSYKHTFFNRDGSVQFSARMDRQSGSATCIRHLGDNGDDVEQANLSAPSDTYAGAALLMYLTHRLQQGEQNIAFHAFTCLPGPRIISMEAARPMDLQEWSMYPGKLLKLEIMPDLGWFGSLVSPFLPKLYAWFDPDRAYEFVGGVFDRYYKGRHILVVKKMAAGGGT